MRAIAPSVILLVVSSVGFTATDVQVSGTTQHTLTLPKLDVRGPLFKAPMSTKSVRFMRIELSEKAKHSLESRAERLMTTSPELNESELIAGASKAVALGMNGVPVLDQGMHGTCATFAVTAAVDAVLNKGDYVSQLCNLQLGNYLAGTTYQPSGWDGSLGRTVLAQMETFGFINKTQEATGNCGGLNEYPFGGGDPVSSIAPETFHTLSEPLNYLNTPLTSSTDAIDVGWSPILDVYEAFSNDVNKNNTLTAIKKALSAGDRVTLGVLLPAVDLGTGGAVGKYHANQDTWVLTPEIKEDITLHGVEAGHEMVITGFDDTAIATDSKGRKYQGLLTLRNSWGSTIGDQGNFYMSYSYFKLLILEAHRIHGTHV